MNTLTKTIRKTTGLSMRQFVEEHLGIKYMTFLYRYKNGVLRLEDYHILSYHTGLTFEQLFPSPYQVPRRLQRIVLKTPTRPPVDKAKLVRAIKKKTTQRRLEAEATPKKKSYVEELLEDLLPQDVGPKRPEKNNPAGDLPFLDVYQGVDLDE